jgi:hypothetical protein
MSQVIVSLYGGLGNQLFQFATALSLAQKKNGRVILDLSWFDKDHLSIGETPRAYALAVYDLGYDVLIQENTKKNSHKHLPRLIDSVLRGVRKYLYMGINRCREKSMKFHPNLMQSKLPIWLDGYWQSYKYFEDIQPALRRIIAVPGDMNSAMQAIYQDILEKDAICIHVRRGDYVTNPSAAQFHGLCDLSYYYAGINLITKNLTSAHAYIFSDDPLWVKDNFKIQIPSTVVDINGPDGAHQDLWLMAACKHFIIANSSLSWWGAWLSGHSNKVVIAPRQWFLNSQASTEDLIPNNWVRI